MASLSITAADEAGMNEAALARLDDAIQGDILAGLYDGAVYIVARQGKVVRHVATGSTALRSGRASGVDDLFCLMSISKSFTSAEILRFVDQGQLSLSTRISEVIPEFATKGKDAVTIFHALTHSGGIWAGFGPPPPLPFSAMGRLETYVPGICNTPLGYEQGTQVAYCPFASFAILGEILVRLDRKGRPFGQIVSEDLFAPLGMRSTRFGLARDAERRVDLVQRDAGPGGLSDPSTLDALNSLMDDKSEMPGAGAFGTAADVFRFAEMLRQQGSLDGYRYLSPAIVHYALQNHTGGMRNITWDYSRQMRGIPEYPANFALLHGYVRGKGHYLSPAGMTAAPEAFVSVGAGTMFLIDPTRDLTFVYLTAGMMEGLAHFARLQRLSDLAIAAVST